MSVNIVVFYLFKKYLPVFPLFFETLEAKFFFFVCFFVVVVVKHTMRECCTMDPLCEMGEKFIFNPAAVH